MTDHQTADEIIAGIFVPPPSERELAQRVTLLQNYVLDLQKTIERLEQQSRKGRDMIQTLRSML
jgi:prefoldin subunit 5